MYLKVFEFCHYKTIANLYSSIFIRPCSDVINCDNYIRHVSSCVSSLYPSCL